MGLPLKSTLEPADFGRRNRWPDPPAVPLVSVKALSATWLCDGEAVTPGKGYRVPADVAAQLVRVGKASLL